MNIDKAKKPIHIRCPYCKKDLQYSVCNLKSRKKGLVDRLRSLENKLGKETIPYNRKVLKDRIKEVMFEIKLINEDTSMLAYLSEVEKMRIFMKKAKEHLGQDLYIQLKEESEKEYLEENTYNLYDLAIQNYTDYEKYLEK